MRFGTDGVRGRAITELTADFALRLGRAAAAELVADAAAPVVCIGRDTRESSDLLAAALGAGFMSAGVDVLDAGVAPTPLVADRGRRDGILGAMVSASHNPFHDNGIKLFAAGGRKLGDDVQARIEARLDERPLDDPGDDAEHAPVGRVGRRRELPPSGRRDYRDHLLAALDGRTLDGLTIVVDCANGAAVDAPDVVAAAGATVVAIADEPDGRNINAGCGATHPGHVAAAVVERGADLGIALDGDADRLIAVDHTGRVVDGDHVIAICAGDLRARGRLAHDTVVVTVMTNLGFRLAMEEAGIRVIETPVGDRYVLEALADGGYSLGGEQSGHVVFADLATTGDGVLTGLVLADVVCRSERPLADIAAEAMTSLPQVLVNVEVADRVPDAAARLADEIAAVESELGAFGRVLVRASGTEPLVRVMVEAPTDQLANAAATRLADVARDRFA